MQVQGLTVETMESIVTARDEGGPFRSLEDFLRRVEIDPADLRLLIKTGAFDSIAGGRSGPELLWRWGAWSAGRGRRRARGRAGGRREGGRVGEGGAGG